MIDSAVSTSQMLAGLADRGRVSDAGDRARLIEQAAEHYADAAIQRWASRLTDMMVSLHWPVGTISALLSPALDPRVRVAAIAAAIEQLSDSDGRGHHLTANHVAELVAMGVRNSLLLRIASVTSGVDLHAHSERRDVPAFMAEGLAAAPVDAHAGQVWHAIWLAKGRADRAGRN